MYRALDMFGELLDRDLEPSERQELEDRLGQIVQVSDTPDIKRLLFSLTVVNLLVFYFDQFGNIVLTLIELVLLLGLI